LARKSFPASRPSILNPECQLACCSCLDFSACPASATHHSLQLFRIPGALHWDLCGGSFHLAEIVGREFHVHRYEVFFQSMQFGRARDRHDPRLLCQQPRECNLSWRHFLLLRESAQQIYQCLVSLSVLLREARDNVAKITLLELCICADLAREK